MTIEQLKNKFIEIYGGTDDNLRVFTAPGRVNLIGEHTDYNGGHVFPAALSMTCTLIVRARNDGEINIAVTDLPDRVHANADNLADFKDIRWGAYQVGVAYILQQSGIKIAGCDMLYHDTVPHGSGLSSSAANEVATAFALMTLAGTDIDKVKVALLSQKAENEYIGVKCGIMDQFASAMGAKDSAILLDCTTLKYEYVPLNMGDYRLILANTKKVHKLGNSKYNERRGECEAGLNALKTVLPGKCCLAEVTPDELTDHINVIKDETVKKRIRHVVSECQRTLVSVEALKRGDLKAFGKYLNESHVSLKNDYEVTGLELDTLAEYAVTLDGVLGGRMTGAGFGGCTVNIVHKDFIDSFIDKVGSHYLEKIGHNAEFYVSEISDGVMEII